MKYIKKLLKKLILVFLQISIVQKIINKMNSLIQIKDKNDKLRVINFYVNNICNSHCVMCNVWKKHDRYSLSLDEFANILSDEIFCEVEHIGITGGEPTLKSNLVEYFKVAIDKLPNLLGISLITNCLNPSQVLERINEIYQLLKYNRVEFSIMLSLDGIGMIHDENRGTKAAFSGFEIVAEELQRKQIPFSTGTTITKINVWDLENILAYVKKKEIPYVFRLAEYIDRLENDDCSKYIRNFNIDEKYQIALFFKKLEIESKDNYNKDYYSNLHHMILGNERQISCDYQYDSVCLNHRGELLFCAPKSPILGKMQNNNGRYLISENQEVKKFLKINNCLSCVHYSGNSEGIDKKREEIKKFLTINNFYKSKQLSKKLDNTKYSFFSIFITGWYGTETVGDKAILGGIIDEYREKNNSCKIYISSLYPFVTEKTIKELNIDNVDIIPVYSPDFFHIIPKCHEVIVGGGPLMELEELSIILWAFSLGNTSRKIVKGCGIGPLYTDEKIKAVIDIIEMADEVYLRDDKSKEYLYNLGLNKDLLVIDDPAIKYVKKFSNDTKMNNSKSIGCYFRELTYEYNNSLSQTDFIIFKEKFENGLAKNISYLLENTDSNIILYAMHNFKVGNDDRDFLYRFKYIYFHNNDRVIVFDKLSTIDTIVKSMIDNLYNICMRYHSVVFASELDTNFISIDYTFGGKIFGYLDKKGRVDRLLNMSEIIECNSSIYGKMLVENERI